MLPLRQKLSAGLQPFTADQILVPGTKITWKCAYPRQGRQWDWGAGTVCGDTSVSLKHQLHFLFSHMGRLQTSGGLGGYQEEGIPGSARLNACSSKPLFSAQSCLIWWLQPHELQCRRCLAATQLNTRKCPSSQGL